MQEVELTRQRDPLTLWPPEVPETALALKNLHGQYLHNEDK